MTKYIAIDLGTTLIKCSLYDETGNTLGIESIPCSPTYPSQNKVEQDADLWYKGVCEVISKLVKLTGAEDIKGISVSSQGISVVPVDENFNPLRTAISWLDTRADKECEFLGKQLSTDEWFCITGKFLSSCYTLPKLLWIKNNEPEIFENAYKFLMPMDFVNARLTGKAVTDHTMASGTMLYSISGGKWDDKLLKLSGIKEEKLPEIAYSGELIGSINEETVKLTGLKPDTLVFNGGQDQKVAAYGAEITPKRGSLSLGTAGALEIFVHDATRQNLMPFFPYTVPGQTLIEGVINTTGAAIEWFRKTIAPEMSFDELNILADKAPIGCEGVYFYPHLSRPGTPHKGNAEFGSVQGISLGTGRGELMRSLYEGLACEIRLNLECIKKCGSDLEELILFGGASKSSVFCQIIADVTNLKILVAENGELGGIGAAKLAAEGLGKDGKSFARKASGNTKIYNPDIKNVTEYNKIYNNYKKHYRNEE